jgi:hypothetical protein
MSLSVTARGTANTVTGAGGQRCAQPCGPQVAEVCPRRFLMPSSFPEGLRRPALSTHAAEIQLLACGYSAQCTVHACRARADGGQRAEYRHDRWCAKRPPARSAISSFTLSACPPGLRTVLIQRRTACSSAPRRSAICLTESPCHWSAIFRTPGPSRPGLVAMLQTSPEGCRLPVLKPVARVRICSRSTSHLVQARDESRGLCSECRAKAVV